MKIFKFNKKRNTQIYKLSDLQKLKIALVDAGKENEATLKALKITSNTDDNYLKEMADYIKDLFDINEKIQKDLATVKKLQHKYNEETKNSDNIYNLEQVKKLQDTIAAFRKNRATKHKRLFSILKLDVKYVQLKKLKEKIQKNMDAINSNTTIRLNLLSNVQLT